MTDREKYLENLKIVRATMDEAIKQVEMEVAKEHEAKRTALVIGQVWKYREGTRTYYIITKRSDKFVLISLTDGNEWSSDGFDGWGSYFTYVGMAFGCVKVEA